MALGLSLAPSAWAGNGPGPRTPVDWSGAPCMTIVDRSQSAVVHLDYAIPMEDTELTEDEVEDSRTHQFFAFCRSRTPQEFMPRWITWADVERARAIGIAPDNIDDPDVLEASEVWIDCFHRINADDDRRPITFEAAAEGIDWDTEGVPAGAYVIDGYTWEPPLNIWSPRPGVIKVVDDPDPAASGPALAIDNVQEFVEKDQIVVIGGCISAQEGSVFDAYWGLPTAEVSWEPIVTEQAVLGDSFSFELDPPDELGGEGLMIRVDATDPSGRRSTAYMSDRVYVLDDEPPVDCEDGSAFVPVPGCEDTGDAQTGDSGDSDPTGSTGATAGQDDEGTQAGSCGGCSTAGPGSSLWLLVLVLLGVRRDDKALASRVGQPAD